jgi:hypothetical protein
MFFHLRAAWRSGSWRNTQAPWDKLEHGPLGCMLASPQGPKAETWASYRWHFPPTFSTWIFISTMQGSAKGNRAKIGPILPAMWAHVSAAVIQISKPAIQNLGGEWQYVPLTRIASVITYVCPAWWRARGAQPNAYGAAKSLCWLVYCLRQKINLFLSMFKSVIDQWFVQIRYNVTTWDVNFIFLQHQTLLKYYFDRAWPTTIRTSSRPLNNN